MKTLISKMNFTLLNLDPMNEHTTVVSSEEQKNKMGCKKERIGGMCIIQ